MDRDWVWGMGWICPVVGLGGNGPLVQGPGGMYVLLHRKESVGPLQISSTVSWHDGTLPTGPRSCNDCVLTKGMRPCWIGTLYQLQGANQGRVWSVGSGDQQFDPIVVKLWGLISLQSRGPMMHGKRSPRRFTKDFLFDLSCLLFPPLPSWSNAGQQPVWKIFNVLRHYRDEFGVSISRKQWAEDEGGLRCSWLALSWKKICPTAWNIDLRGGRWELQRVWCRCLTSWISSVLCWVLLAFGIHAALPLACESEWKCFKCFSVCRGSLLRKSWELFKTPEQMPHALPAW